MNEPWVVAAPGLFTRDVAGRSTVVMKVPPASAARAIMQPSLPHRVSVPCGETSLELDAGNFTVLEVRHGVVGRMTVTPHLDLLSPQDAASRVAELSAALLRAGFALRDELSLGEVSSTLLDHDAARVMAFDAPFGSGAWHAELWLKVSARRSSRLGKMLRLDADAHVLSFELWDAALTSLERMT